MHGAGCHGAETDTRSGLDMGLGGASKAGRVVWFLGWLDFIPRVVAFHFSHGAAYMGGE
jgi:hypothetical protein